MTQFAAFATLVLKADNMSLVITFKNLTQPILVGFTLLDIFIITACLLLVYLCVFLYMLPLTVAVDEENPLPWYYPCVCSCLRKQGAAPKEQTIHAEDIEDAEAPLSVKAILPVMNDAGQGGD